MQVLLTRYSKEKSAAGAPPLNHDSFKQGAVRLTLPCHNGVRRHMGAAAPACFMSVGMKAGKGCPYLETEQQGKKPGQSS